MPSTRRAKSAGSPPGGKKPSGVPVLKQPSNTGRPASLVAPGRGSRIVGPVNPFSGAVGVRTSRPVVSVPPGRGSKVNVPPGFFPSGIGPKVAVPAISGSAVHQSKVPGFSSVPHQNVGKKAASAVPAGHGSIQSVPGSRSSNPLLKRAVWSTAGAVRGSNAEPSGSTQPGKGGTSPEAATATSAEALQVNQERQPAESSSSAAHDKIAEKTDAKKLLKRR
jgi:hypothetical protein